MNASKLRKVVIGLLALIVVSAVGFWSLGGQTA
jgi:hypothetical protein